MPTAHDKPAPIGPDGVLFIRRLPAAEAPPTPPAEPQNSGPRDPVQPTVNADTLAD